VYTKVQASCSRTSRIPTISTILPSLHPIATHDVPPTIEFRGFSAMCRYRQTLLSKAKTVRGRSSPQRSSLFPVTFFETPTFPSQHQGSTLRKFSPPRAPTHVNLSISSSSMFQSSTTAVIVPYLKHPAHMVCGISALCLS
jgi:hypothetical protein